MSKRVIQQIADAYEKTLPKRKTTIEEVKDFTIGFTTDDISTNMRGGKVSVLARISKEDFDKIVYSYRVYILDYFEEKGLVKRLRV